MKIKKITSKFLSANQYVIINDNKCIVIDPCINYNETIKLCSNIEAVLITHGHCDHILELDSYLNKNIKIYMHKKAYEKLISSYKNCSTMCGFELIFNPINLESEKINYVSNDEFVLIDKKVRSIENPGHTNCCVSYIIDDNMFTGDFLFKGSIGRTDLPTGNSTVMKLSLDKIKEFKEDFVIYPGHDNETTLFEEIKYNRYLK